MRIRVVGVVRTSERRIDFDIETEEGFRAVAITVNDDGSLEVLSHADEKGETVKVKSLPFGPDDVSDPS